MEKVRIFLVDDHKMFRDALRSLLEKKPDYQVVGETGDAFEVCKLVGETSPHIVCMDIGMTYMNGIEITRHLLKQYPQVRVIALSTHSDHKFVIDMMNAGASAYITKAEAADELYRAIAAVRNKRKYYCTAVAEALASALSLHSGDSLPNRLGNRERQVLQLVAEGHTTTKIANLLCIAPSTVEVHRRNIMRKLDLHNVADLTRYAVSHGIVCG